VKLFCSNLNLSPLSGTIYRYPSLWTEQASGLLLALAQKFVFNSKHGSDETNVRTEWALRKSKDNGKTWGSEKIVQPNGSRSFSPGLRPAFFELSHPNRIRILGTPCAIDSKLNFHASVSMSDVHSWIKSMDTQTTSNTNDISCLYSGDAGETWNQEKILLEKAWSPKQLKQQSKGTWEWGTCGGRSIRLKRQPDVGRLLLPVFWRRRFELTQEKELIWSYSGSLVSTAPHHGDHWLFGDPTGPGNAECRFVELADRLVLMHARDRDTRQKSSVFRRLAASPSQGMSWVGPNDDKDLPDQSSFGGWTRYSRIAEGAKWNRTLMTQYIKDAAFEGLVIRLSYEEGMTWSAQKYLHHGAVDQSEITALNDRFIGVIYEQGSSNFPWQSIDFQCCSIADITEGEDTDW